ncbi:MAG: Ig-like domain-containing protein [Planctomycetota bacterium]|jgi:filamentous hemagglutinin family protein
MMERIRRSLKGRSWRKVITYFLTCCLFLNMSLPVASAEVVLQPDGVIRGEIDVSPLGTGTLQEMAASDGAIGHFSDFDIASGHMVNCVQPGTDASALFRVYSGDGTQILGRFDATGHIYLVDTAGILFGPDSQINVTRLVASGLEITDPAFDTILEGGEMEFAGGDGEITNRCKLGITNADGVYLIGEKVLNLGPIIVNEEGLIVIAAGDQVILAQDGSNISVAVSGPRDGLANPDINNRNILRADNGTVLLAAGDIFSSAIRNASFLAASGGTVKVQAAIVENNGSINVNAPGGSAADGGNINITGTEQVINAPTSDIYDSLTADAGTTGNGGNITIETEGTVTIGENAVVTASGGSTSGNGGTVSITCDDFEIVGEISASPGNKIYEPGKLEITTPSATIADGAHAGTPDVDTLYEDDIEALSQSGTSLVVNAAESITVEDITDNEITGQFGDIQLLADKENPDSFVSFDDTGDTIRTTLGDIIISAGGQGINVGNLTTGKDLTDEKPTPGKIFLTTGTTEVSGNITTGDLIVRDGWGTAEIDVKSSGNLTINGDVIVGSESDIFNVADEKAAEAMVILRADKDVKLNGIVEAKAHGSEVDESVTKAYIDVIAGDNANISGDLYAKATPSSSGTAEAVITVEAVGDIDFPGSATAEADDATAESTGPDHEDDEDTTPTGYAQVTIDDSAIFLVDDIGIFFTPKSDADVVLDVLANDTLEGEATIVDAILDNPAEGTLTIGMAGDKTVLYYDPPEDLSILTFDENGKAVVTFTYFVDGKDAAGDVTLINGLPVAVEDIAASYMGNPVNIDVLINDIEPDPEDILTAIPGSITAKNGTVVLNEDGTFTYTPNEGFFGDDTFTYSATDSYNTSSEVVVKITSSETPPIPPSLPYTQAAPGLDRLELEVKISGCPALVKWVAEEVGIDERLVQIWVANSLASTGNIQPCNACQALKNSAKILLDADGTHIAALAQVVNEFASSTAPPTEEQMVAIANAIARNMDEDSYYAVADEYLEALTTYVGILSDEMGFSATESVQLVTDKYVGRLAQGQNVGVAAFIAASLAALGG